MDDLAGHVVILSGPPGVGKTTIAGQLVARGGAPGVHLHADDFWGFIRHGGIAPYLPEARAQNGVVMGVLVQAAAQYASGGFLVVLDGVVGPWFLDRFGGIGVPLHYLVLRLPVKKGDRPLPGPWRRHPHRSGADRGPAPPVRGPRPAGALRPGCGRLRRRGGAGPRGGGGAERAL
jgi:hypothetical protein